MLQLRKAALLMHSLSSSSRATSSGGSLRVAGSGGLTAGMNSALDGDALIAGGSGGELSLAQQQLLQAGSAVGLAGRGSGGGSAPPPLSQREQQEAAVGWDPHLVRRSAYAGIAPPDSADEAEMRRELGFPVPGDERRLKNAGVCGEGRAVGERQALRCGTGGAVRARLREADSSPTPRLPSPPIAATIPRLPAIPLKHGPRAPNPVGSGITGVSRCVAASGAPPPLWPPPHPAPACLPA